MPGHHDISCVSTALEAAVDTLSALATSTKDPAILIRATLAGDRLREARATIGRILDDLAPEDGEAPVGAMSLGLDPARHTRAGDRFVGVDQRATRR